MFLLCRSSFAAGERLVLQTVRFADSAKAGTAKTNRPDFFRGKQPVFPSGEKQSRRQTPITLFKRNAALCRLRFTEVANHGARAVIDSEKQIRKLSGAA